MEEGGEKRKEEVFFSPLALPFFFFCSGPNFLDELVRKCLLPRLVTQSARSRRSYGKIGDFEPCTTATTTRITCTKQENRKGFWVTHIAYFPVKCKKCGPVLPTYQILSFDFTSCFSVLETQHLNLFFLR